MFVHTLVGFCISRVITGSATVIPLKPLFPPNPLISSIISLFKLLLSNCCF